MLHPVGFCPTFSICSANSISPDASRGSEQEAAGSDLGNQPGGSPGGPATLGDLKTVFFPDSRGDYYNAKLKVLSFLPLPTHFFVRVALVHKRMTTFRRSSCRFIDDSIVSADRRWNE